MSSRPDYISKLAIYLQSKEPLIYLFIINTDFINDLEGNYLGSFPAGVKYENKRVKFYYKPDFLEKLSARKLYFIILHEAFHIFKRHLERHEKLENKLLCNYSQDAVINYEIKNLNFSYDLVPEMIEGCVEIPDEFFYNFTKIGKEAVETNRIYYWMLKNNKKFQTIDFNLIFQDKHFSYDKENSVEEKLFTEKLIHQAKKIESTIKEKIIGNKKGSLISTIEKLLKPKINWKRELNKRMNVFFSENSFLKEKKKNIINYPWNAVSQYGILGKYWIKTIEKLQTYIIFAIDTSGSVFSDKNEIETFFTEIDAASKELEFNKRGQILTIQWDTEIQEGLKVYKSGAWKNFNLEGGGGTSPQVVFKYLEKVFKKINKSYLIKEDGINFIIPNENKLPFLIFLTDGYFFKKLCENDLLLYKNNKKNILYFTKNINDIYPLNNYIIYEG